MALYFQALGLLQLCYQSQRWPPCMRIHTVAGEAALLTKTRDPVVGAQYRWSAAFAPGNPEFWGLIQGMRLLIFDAQRLTRCRMDYRLGLDSHMCSWPYLFIQCHCGSCVI